MTTRTRFIALLTSAALVAAASAQAAGLGGGIGAGSIGTPGAGSSTSTVTPPGTAGGGTSGSVRSNSQVATLLQARGFTSVTNVHANSNGSYTATATKNGQI